jgi:hypothetical protein
LAFGFYFNQPIDNLPSKLLNIIFEHHFNQNINNLPGDIKYITFKKNGEFNKNIDKLSSSIVIEYM